MAATMRLSSETDGQLQLTTLKYDWTIKNVLKFVNPRATESVYSDPFEMDADASWQAVISRSHGTLMIGLKFLGSSVFGPFSPTPAEFNCTIKDMYVCERMYHVFDSQNSEKCVRAYRELHEMLTPTAELTITYCITKRKGKPFSIPSNQLLRDLDLDDENQELTSIDLWVDKTPFKAQQEILTARSPVFAAMFVTENQEDQVQIDDVDSEVFEQVLQYIYTDKAEIKPTTAAALLAAAENYDLERLKAGCEHALFTYISVPTAIDTLVLAEEHDAKQLKTHTLQFIKTNADAVMKTPGWKTLIEYGWRQQLLLDVYRAMANK